MRTATKAAADTGDRAAGDSRSAHGVDACLVCHSGKILRTLSCAWRLRRPPAFAACSGRFSILWKRCSFIASAGKNGIRHLHAHFANVASDVAALLASILNAGTFSYTMHDPTEFFDIAHHRLAEENRARRARLCCLHLGFSRARN